jgi:hypothetical protein
MSEYLLCYFQPSVLLYFRIDKDGSLSLDWTEWRNFFQLYPSGDLEDMVSYWRQSLVRSFKFALFLTNPSQDRSLLNQVTARDRVAFDCLIKCLLT